MRVVLNSSAFIATLFITAAAGASGSPGSPNMLISEFRTRGPNGANDEFITLYNRAAVPVALDGWKVMRSPGVATGGSPSQLLQIAANTTVPPGGFFLLTNTGLLGYSGLIVPDATYKTGIDDDGGIALLDASGTVIDAVGMSAATAYSEGTPLVPMASNVNQSYERNNGGCYPDHDTDNNAQDFRFNGSASFAKDSTSSCSNCTSVVCQLPPTTQCWDINGLCEQGACNYNQWAVDAPCSDGTACTTGEKCDSSGACVGGSPVTCTPPPAFCSDAFNLVTYTSDCDPAAGCQNTPSSQYCAWGCNSSTLQCNPYPCTGTCSTPPTNGCYTADAGICQLNGTCEYTHTSLGTACEDGDLCTTGEACDSNGGCAGGTPVNIDDGNPCTVDSCDSATGHISHTPVTIGSYCDDNDLCNGRETCQIVNAAIACVSGTAVTCNTPSAGGCYAPTGTCDPTTGICSYAPLDQTKTCNDGDICTTADRCDGMGACAGATVVCADNHHCADSSTSRLYYSGSCNATSGICDYSTTDTPCPFGCDSDSGLCKGDPCLGIACDNPPDTCHVGSCSNGTCVYQLKPQDSACDDGNACTSVDKCSAAGACQGTPVDCNAPPAVHACANSATSRTWDVTGSCLSNSGLCAYTYTDTNCTFGCDAASGLCAQDPCIGTKCDQAPDQCHESLGICSNGVCTFELKQPGSGCDDSNACTKNDVCTADGTCRGTAVVCNNPPPASCSSNDSSHAYSATGSCNGLGACDYTATDTACSTGCNSETGLCNADPCANVACNAPPGACYASLGQCNAGTCTYAPISAGIACDDHDPCTTQDACNGTGQCVGTPTACGTGGTSGAGGDSAIGGSASSGGSLAAGGSPAAGGVSTTDTTAGNGGSIAAGGAATIPDSTATVGGAVSSGGVPSSNSTSAQPSGGGSTGAGGTSDITGSGGNSTVSNGTGGAVALGGANGTTAIAGSSPTAGTAAQGVGGSTATRTGSTGGLSSSTAIASSTTTALHDAGSTEAATTAASSDNGGCGCSVPKSDHRAAWVVALLAVLGLRRRRRQ